MSLCLKWEKYEIEIRNIILYYILSNNRESSFMTRISLGYSYSLKTILETWTLIKDFIFIKIFTFCLLSKVLQFKTYKVKLRKDNCIKVNIKELNRVLLQNKLLTDCDIWNLDNLIVI